MDVQMMYVSIDVLMDVPMDVQMMYVSIDVLMDVLMN